MCPTGRLHLLHVNVHVGVPANENYKLPEKVHQDTITDLSYFRVLLILQCVVLTQHTHLLTTVHWEGVGKDH